MDALVSLYRPRVFSEVFGQDYPVRILSQLIKRGQICRNILLYGSVGSGKTTLARIYGKALNCDSPDEDGSPCLQCSSCKKIEKGEPLRFKELDAPLFETLDQFKYTVDIFVSGPLDHRRLIFVDEAHSIARFTNGYEFLLKMVEEVRPGIAFCFATTEVDRISAALRSRLFEIEIRPLGLDQGITFLRNIANKEEIQYEDEALALLAGLGQGQPRNLLQALDQVREVGDVTREQVRGVFGIDQSEKLVAYFMALAEGDFARQTQVISTWNEDLREQVRLLQLFLLSLYYNDLLKIRLILDPMVASITALERQPIVLAFKARLGVTDADPLSFWQRMIELLPIVSSDESEEALRIRLTLFQRFVTDAPRGMAQPQNFPQSPAVPVPQSPSPARRPVPKKPGRKHRRRRGPVPVQDPAYLSFDVVRDLFNAASFLLQQYDGPCCFNTQITIPYRLFKFNNEKEESQFLSDFYRELVYYFDRSFHCKFHRLSVLEHDEQLGLCARVIIHVPNEPEKEELLQKWLHDWRAEQRIGAPRGLEIRVDSKRFSSKKLTVSYHWQCVRWLCAGLDPNDERLHALKLKRTPRRTAGIIGKRRRFSTSESLSSKSRDAAVQCKMEFLSAFDDEAWNHLEDGWELVEYSDRRKELVRRKKDVAVTKAKFLIGKSKADDAKRESALTALENSWPEKYEWPRSWPMPVWWLNEQN
jgi:DNA polymerase III subunit gamma/tau